VRWNAPPRESVKLNFDGSYHHSSAAAGFIIRDRASTLIKAGTAAYGDSSILVAKARALRDGLHEAAKVGIKNLFIEGDNALVIKALQGTSGTPWKLQMLLHDMSTYLNLMDHVNISHIFRVADMAVDYMAKLGHATSKLTTWDCPPTTKCQNILFADLMGCALMRRGV